MWGQPGVTTRLLLSNGQAAWGAGGSPINTTILRGDILRDLLVSTSGSITLGGTTAPSPDVHAPYNLYTNIALGPSNSAKIVNVSGYGLYLANLLTGANQISVYDSPDIVVANPSTFADVLSVPTATGAFRYYQRVPVSQLIRSLGYEIGLWQLSEQTMNMVLSMTPNAGNAASPYNVYNPVAGQGLYTGGTGTPTATLANPAIDIYRRLYKNPARPEDYPPVDFVSVWSEDIFQNALTTTPTYTFPANSGLLARAAINLFDATAGNGADVPAYLANNNALTLLYGTSDTKISESGYEHRENEAQEYGFLPPRGVFFYDFLGRDLTLSDVLNTATLLNIRFQLNLSQAMPANSSATVVYQLLQPIVAA